LTPERASDRAVERVQCIVVGAGAVGLAVARSLAFAGREVVVIESEADIGTGVSSRNSGVIHAGIYYDNDSLKARVCVQGKHALYRFCKEHGVSHARVGKLVVATDAAQLPALEALRVRARGNGVDDLEYLTPEQVNELEPVVRCAGALLSPSTGIVDVHEYMLALEGDAERYGAVVALATEFVGAQMRGDGLRISTGGNDPMTLECDWLVNCAGLGAQTVAARIAGLDADTIPPLYPAKGNYFQLTGPCPFRRLIYPMPDAAWLGVHVGLDLAGRCKFGPDLHWVDALDYDVDAHQSEAFYASIRRYWPDLPDGSLEPDYTGIRPKIYAKGQPARDFYIQCADEHGVHGLVNLYGIESPGLTSSIAIGEHVAALIAQAA
jgi:L-2-hydroxyglutarate oxidase LhgO